MFSKTLPVDCRLLEIKEGALLVSRSHAVFCRIPSEQVPSVQRSMGNGAGIQGLDFELVRELEIHGFFGEPRPRETQTPVVQLQLTNECNLTCAYCCTNSNKPRKKELSHAQWKGVLEDVRSHLGKGAPVAFLGGEPLLVPHAVDLFEYASDIELSVTVFSNGIPLLNEQAICKRMAGLTRSGLELRISLAGTDAAFCDDISNSKRFEKVFAALEAIYKLGGKARIDLMLMPQNASSIALELDGFKKRLPDECAVTLGVLYASGRETGEHLFERRMDLEDFLTQIAFESGVAIRSTEPSPTTFLRDGCDCAVGLNLHVRSDGALFSCFKMEEQIAHLDHMGIKEALRYVAENPTPASVLNTCRECPLATICGGGCRSENFLYTGTGEPVCGPWRVRVLSELLAEDNTDALQWPLAQLFNEATFRGIAFSATLPKLRPSRHCVDV